MLMFRIPPRVGVRPDGLSRMSLSRSEFLRACSHRPTRGPRKELENACALQEFGQPGVRERNYLDGSSGDLGHHARMLVCVPVAVLVYGLGLGLGLDPSPRVYAGRSSFLLSRFAGTFTGTKRSLKSAVACRSSTSTGEPSCSCARRSQLSSRRATAADAVQGQ